MLPNDPMEDLNIQLKVFHNYQTEDFAEFALRFEDVENKLKSMLECSDLIYNTISNSPAEKYFLLILQHLVCMRDDMYTRPAYYKLIEGCVSQVVLHKNGCSPYFRATQQFQIDVELVIKRIEEMESKEVKEKLEDAEAQISIFKDILHYEQDIRSIEEKIANLNTEICENKITSSTPDTSKNVDLTLNNLHIIASPSPLLPTPHNRVNVPSSSPPPTPTTSLTVSLFSPLRPLLLLRHQRHFRHLFLFHLLVQHCELTTKKLIYGT